MQAHKGALGHIGAGHLSRSVRHKLAAMRLALCVSKADPKLLWKHVSPLVRQIDEWEQTEDRQTDKPSHWNNLQTLKVYSWQSAGRKDEGM